MKKVNTILSFLIIILCLVSITACTNKTDSNDETAEKEETKEISFLDNDKSYFILIDGKKYYAGDKISDLAKSGFTIREKEKNENAPAGKYIIGGGYMVNSENVSCFNVTPYNIKDTDVTIGQTVIGGFSIDAYNAKKDTKAQNIEIYGKIKIGSTKSDVVSAFGTASNTTTGTNYTVYYYYSSKVYRSFTIRFDENDTVSNIKWQNLEFNR